MNRKKSLVFNLISVIAAAILIFIDQLSKQLVVENLSGGREFVIIKGVFKLVSHRNTGAVWGIMSDKTSLLAVITVIILAGVIYFYIKLPFDNKRLRILKIICVFVFAGAVGNLIDRVKLKYVVDFLYFELIDFPVFNIADCYITVSMILILILFIFYYKEEDFDLIWPKKSE